MDNVLVPLLSETLKFMELCQGYYLENGGSYEEYSALTKLKLEFLNFVLRTEKGNYNICSELKEKIYKVFYNDSSIYFMMKKVAGNNG